MPTEICTPSTTHQGRSAGTAEEQSKWIHCYLELSVCGSGSHRAHADVRYLERISSLGTVSETDRGEGSSSSADMSGTCPAEMNFPRTIVSSMKVCKDF